MKKPFVLVLLLGLCGGLGWLVWFRPVKAPEEEKKPEAEAPVRVGRIARATLHSYVVAYGVVEPAPRAGARLAVGVPGMVTAVLCAEGQTVAAGDLLFQIDGRAAEVAVHFAELTLERQRKLAEGDGTSRKLVQEAEQQLAAAQAQLALLQIRAPIKGTITKVNVKAGEAADLSTVLGELIDFDRLAAVANVAAADLALLRQDQPAEVTTGDATNVLTSSVTFVSAQVDPKTGSGLVRVALPAGSALRPGQFVRVRATTQERKDCLAAPLSGLARDPSGGSFLALVDGDKAVLRPVKPGIREGDLVEVEGEGIEAGKTVVTEGAYGLIMTQQFATRIRVVGE